MKMFLRFLTVLFAALTFYSVQAYANEEILHPGEDHLCTIRGGCSSGSVGACPANNVCRKATARYKKTGSAAISYTGYGVDPVQADACEEAKGAALANCAKAHSGEAGFGAN